MDDLFGFLCGLAFALAVMTVLGHGIWVAIAWVVGALSGEAGSDSGRPCPSCGARFGVKQGRCLVCGATPGFAAGSTLRDELKVTARQLRRLLDRGAITHEQYDSLASVIQADLAAQSRAGLQPARPVSPPAIAPAEFNQAAPEPGLVPDNVDSEVIEALVVPEPGIVFVSPAPAIAQATAAPQKRHPLDPDPVSPFAPAPANITASRHYGGVSQAPPATASRSLGEMLQAFMEETNVRVMEIIAGLAIIVSSIGLVWSLWSTLNTIPYFPAILFTAFTVAFHGAGLYTLRRWKLQGVSRVVLLISLLLVPLAISGAVVMSGSGARQTSVSDPLFLAAVAIGALVFGWVAWSASSVLVGEARGRLTIAVVGCSLAQIAIHRLSLLQIDFWRISAIAAVPLGCYLVATIGQLIRARRWPQLSERRVGQIMLVLGAATFALLAPLVLIFVRARPTWSAVAHLSPGLSLAVSSVLALGLLIHRRTTAKRLAAWQTAGTALLVFAAALLLLLVGFTWPDPQLLVAIGLINCLVLAALAILGELPLLYVPSVSCAALAAVIGVNLADGRYADVENLSLAIVQSALLTKSGLILTVLAAAVAGIGGWCYRQRRTADALMLLASTGGLAVLATAVALFAGFIHVPDWPPDPLRDWSPLLLLLFVGTLLTAAPRTRSPVAAASGSLLLWIALVQLLLLNETCRGWLLSLGWLPDRPIFVATLIHGVATAFGALVGQVSNLPPLPSPLAGEWPGARRRSLQSGWPTDPLAQPLAIGSAISLIAAIPAILWVWNDGFGWHAIFAIAAAAGWLALAIGQRWNWAISGLQVMTFLAPAFAVAGYWQARLNTENWPLTQPHLLSQLVLLGLGAVIWAVLRRLTSGRSAVRDLLNAPWFAVDQQLLAVAAVALPALAVTWAMPLVSAELNLPNSAKIEPAVASLSYHSVTLPWIALAVVVAALLIALWERINFPAIVGLGIATYSAVWFAAELFQTQVATASAARWAAAVFALAWGLAFIAREPLRAAAKRLPWLRWSRFESHAQEYLCAQPLAFGGLTVLLLTLVAVAQSVGGIALGGPLEGSFFDRIGPTASYAIPLLAIVGVLLGYALREQQPGFALGGSAVFQLAVNLAFMLYVSHSTVQPPAVRWAEWLQWNTLALGGFALVWLSLDVVRAAIGRLRPTSTAATSRPIAIRLADTPLLDLQIAAASAGVLLIAGTAALRIFEIPGAKTPEFVQLGSLASYAALGLALAAVIWRSQIGHVFNLSRPADLAAILLLALVAIIAATADRFDIGGHWIAYHTLTVGWLGVGIILCGLVSLSRLSLGGRGAGGEGPIASRVPAIIPHHLTAATIAALVVVLAVRGNWLDPQQPWWSLGAMVGSFAIATALGLANRSQAYAYTSTLLAGLAVILFWITSPAQQWNSVAFGWQPGVVETLLFVLAAVAAFWLTCEIRHQMRANEAFAPLATVPPVHITVVLLLLPLVFLFRLGYVFASTELFRNVQPEQFTAYAAAAIVATLALGGLIVATLWDRRGWIAIPAVYVWSGMVWLLAIGLAGPWIPQQLRDLAIEYRLVALIAALALHVAISGQTWSYGANLAAIGGKLGISDPIGGLARTSLWLPGVSVLLAAIVCVVDLVFVLRIDQQSLRVVAAFGPAIAAWGVLCLAQEKRRDAFQLASLLLAGLAAVYLGWAQIAPLHTPEIWMDRVFRLLMVLAALTFGYGLVLPRWLLTAGSWNAATRRAGYIAGVAAIATFAATLILEVSLFRPGLGAPVDGLQVVAIAGVLLLLIAGLVSLALLPGRDPLMLSETNRQAYVYAAQAIAALLFAHLYVCRPLWFDSVLRPYWPFIVMGLAFLGVGAAELFHRWKLTVLAQPLERTGALLPILPVIGMWIVTAETDYALVLFVVGLLYLALSVTRKSWLAMAAATVAGNAALWALLHDIGTDFSFAAHPQFWLIPPALSVLIAAQVNRHRLQPEMLTAIRYGAMVVIYLSSTTEIFLRGIGDSVWSPIILLSLALLGAFAGVMLRVRAFLFLGGTFTLIGLVAMVWHANRAIDHTWPGWAFGITAGIAILILFGLFEKNRPEILALITRLKQWEQ